MLRHIQTSLSYHSPDRFRRDYRLGSGGCLGVQSTAEDPAAIRLLSVRKCSLRDPNTPEGPIPNTEHSFLLFWEVTAYHFTEMWHSAHSRWSRYFITLYMVSFSWISTPYHSMSWTLVSSKVICGNLIANVMLALGHRAIGKRLGHKGSPYKWDYKTGPQRAALSTTRGCYEEHIWPKHWALIRHWKYSVLIVNLPVSVAVWEKKKTFVYKLLSLWYFVIAGSMD